jgi:hypothetical protein
MILGETNEEYHSNKSVSSSKLKTLMTKGAAAYEQLYLSRSHVPKQTAAMKKGSDFEDAVCDRIELAFVPDGMKLTTKEGRAFKDENAGKLIISTADRGFFQQGVGNVRRVLDKYSLWGDEQPTFRRPYDGLPGIQARPDWFVKSKSFSVDLKTTESLHKFQYKIEDYLYHMQAAFVRVASGIDATQHPLVVVEKSFPYPCRVVWLSEDYVRDGVDLLKRGVDKLAHHYRTQTWPLLERDSITIQPPERVREYLHLGRDNAHSVDLDDICF